jgi:hypothetical protein
MLVLLHALISFHHMESSPISHLNKIERFAAPHSSFATDLAAGPGLGQLGGDELHRVLQRNKKAGADPDPFLS